MHATLTHAARTAAEHDHAGLLCSILVIGVIIAFILGIAEALGLTSFTARAGAGRFGTLLIAVILLVVYLVLC